MKSFNLIIVALFFFSNCVSKIENQVKYQIPIEVFGEFYFQFSNNDSFRLERTKLPFPYVSIEKDDDSGVNIKSLKMINIFPIELNKKKWKEKVIFTNQTISFDSMKTVINIEDTGYHVEILYILDSKSKKWFAVQVENSSI